MAERSIELDSIELAAAIFGNCDQNIHLLEKEFSVTAVCRGSELRFTGAEKDVTAAAHAVDGMGHSDAESYPSGGADHPVLHQPCPRRRGKTPS